MEANHSGLVHILPFQKCSIMLQPVVNMGKDEVQYYQTVFIVSGKDVFLLENKNSFGSHWLLDFIQSQIDMLVLRYSRGEKFCIQFPSSMLSHLDNIEYLLQSRLHERVVLLLTPSFDTEDVEVQADWVKNIQLLQESGYEVWLNDISLAHAANIGSLCLKFDGVKIKRQELVFSSPNERDFLLLKLLGDKLIISGIDSAADLEFASRQAAGLCCGELWRNRVVKSPSPAVAALKHLRCEKHHRKTVRAFLTMTDRFYVAGLLALTEECLCQAFSVPAIKVVMVQDEHDADIVFRDCWPGEMPYDIRRSNKDPRYRHHLARCLYVGVYSLCDENGYQSRSGCPPPCAIAASFWRGASLQQIRNVLTCSIKKVSSQYYNINRNNFTACEWNKPLARESLARVIFLSLREKKLVRRFGEGKSLANIAMEFNFSVSTVNYHRQSVMKKMKMDSMQQFKQYAQWLSFFDTDQEPR